MTKRWIPILAGGAAATLLTGMGVLVVPSIAGAIPDDGRINACYGFSGGALPRGGRGHDLPRYRCRDMPTITFVGGYMTAQTVSLTSMENEPAPAG